MGGDCMEIGGRNRNVKIHSLSSLAPTKNHVVEYFCYRVKNNNHTRINSPLVWKKFLLTSVIVAILIWSRKANFFQVKAVTAASPSSDQKWAWVNKPVFGYLRTLTTWHCPHSHRRTPLLQQSIDIFCPPRKRSWCDRQMDWHCNVT